MKTHSYTLLLIVLVGLLTFVGSCSNGSTDSGNDEFDRAALLLNVADNIIIPSYTALNDAARDLDAALTSFEADQTANTLAMLQQELLEARLAWQDASLFQFGPAESVALRSTLNTFPTDTDKIDANITSNNYILGTIANIDAGGFPALDYLLHGTGATDAEILEQFTTANDADNRLGYVRANVNLIRTLVSGVVTQWTEGAAAYRTTFLSSENAGVDVGSSLGQVVNALTLHFERFTRDGKIGIPAGVRSAGIARPTTTEAFYSGDSRALAVANMLAVQRLFLGTSLSQSTGIGLDDNLQALGAEDLSNDIQSEIAGAIVAIEELGDPLSTTITNDLDSVLATFSEMQQVVVLIKADLASTLGISITFQDNDGD